MEISELKAITEGLLFVSGDEGLTLRQMKEILNVKPETVRLVLDELATDYRNADRGIIITHTKQVYYLTTKANHSVYYKKLLETPRKTVLSQAALETLAIIAYQQPITRIEIEEIRGVNSDRPVKTLVSRSLVEEVGRRNAIGRPALFGTTTDFLTYFGLTSLEELPPLPSAVDEAEVEKEADLFFERLNNIEQIDEA